MKTKTFFLSVLPLFLFLMSCSNSVEEVVKPDPVVTPNPDPGSGPNPNPNPVTAISFANAVKPIIDNNCISCHNGSQFPDLRSYSGIKANASSVSARVANRSMPLGGSLTQEQINTVVKWVSEGAQNN